MINSETLISRLGILLTGRVSWLDPHTGAREAETISLRDRWAVFGVHSYNWWWVHRYGRRSCGCVINPLTRRKVLTSMDCPDHGFRDLLDEL